MFQNVILLWIVGIIIVLIYYYFDAWIPKKKFEKYMGPESGLKGTFLLVIFSIFQAGPLYGAFPIVYILYKKALQ
ncbi:MAG: hypothetical protein RBS85_00625 [Methanofastidiosum sp.]|jgi:hypothetical protein|nr:hypothetical protein [Methanofastidiosum sp.]